MDTEKLIHELVYQEQSCPNFEECSIYRNKLLDTYYCDFFSNDGECLFCSAYTTIRKLQEEVDYYKNMNKTNILVRPTCSIGDKVYMIKYFDMGTIVDILESTVEEIIFSEPNMFNVICRYQDFLITLDGHDFKKTWFFTKEEAEAMVYNK